MVALVTLVALRFKVVSVKLTGTPSMNPKNQEILREFGSTLMALKPVGGGGAPAWQ